MNRRGFLSLAVVSAVAPLLPLPRQEHVIEVTWSLLYEDEDPVIPVSEATLFGERLLTDSILMTQKDLDDLHRWRAHGTLLRELPEVQEPG